MIEIQVLMTVSNFLGFSMEGRVFSGFFFLGGGSFLSGGGGALWRVLVLMEGVFEQNHRMGGAAPHASAHFGKLCY